MSYFRTELARLAATAQVEGPPRTSGRAGALENYALDLIDVHIPAAQRECDRQDAADDRLAALQDLERVALSLLDYAGEEKATRARARHPRAPKTTPKTTASQAPRVTIGRITMRGGTR